MRRGGTLRPPRPRAPAATRPVPPFRPSEGQVFHTDSRDFKDQSFREARGLPRKGADFWKGLEGQQTLLWEQPCPENRREPTEPSAVSGQEPQPQAVAVF